MPRAIFAKRGNAVWISHLDLMRVLQRSFRRAGLLLAHSQGFTPHPCLSLALPMSVGVSSECEVMDFTLVEGQDCPDLRERLNRVLPEGIEILEAYEPVRKIRELTHLRVCLRMCYDGGVPAGTAEALHSLFARSELLTEKRTKSGAFVTQNIRELMDGIALEQTDGKTLLLRCTVCAQNPSLNPALICAVISRELPAFAPDFTAISRLAVLDAAGRCFR